MSLTPTVFDRTHWVYPPRLIATWFGFRPGAWFGFRPATWFGFRPGAWFGFRPATWFGFRPGALGGRRTAMGIVESVRGVLWARKRQPDEIAYGIALGSERFSPASLLEQALAAEQAGF